MRITGFLTLLLLSGCSGSGEPAPEPQGQPPVIVVQAPPDTEPGTETAYDEMAWQAMGQGSAGGQADAPQSEPYEMVALLREFDPVLTDAPKDAASELPSDDLLSAFVVMDDTNLYGRILGRASFANEGAHETRFWIEQGGNMVTVEVKVPSEESACELSDIKAPETQKAVPGCYFLGNALDFRFPLAAIPPIIDVSKPYWVSGFQTCCSDEARNEPYDEIEGAQEVWRVPGTAADVDTGGGGEAPEAPATPESGG